MSDTSGMNDGARPQALMQGTLDVLILKAVALEPLHGLGVARRIEQLTRGTFVVKPGSLFPALHRMEDKGWLRSHWGESAARRKARYYALTAAGRRHLATEKAQWGRIATAMAHALETA